MSQYYNVVPWFNSEEWHEVFCKIWLPSSTLQHKKEALDILLIWKARCPALPSGIESTLGLLNVYLEDVHPQNERSAMDGVLRLAYSSAIMRFVNHMLDTETAKGASLYQAAKNLDVPDWVIDLRHDTAHSNNLPTIAHLRDAALLSLEWLQNNYWNKHKEYIKDYVTGIEQINEIEGNKCLTMMNLYIALGIVFNSVKRIKNVAEIPDESLKETVVGCINEIFGAQVDLTNLKTVSLLTIINMLNEKTRKTIGTKNSRLIIKNTLLGEGSLILSIDVFRTLSERDISEINSLSKNFVQFYELLLTFLHSNNYVLDFLQELIEVTLKDEFTLPTRKLAALWISEILRALKRSKAFVQKVTISASDNTSKSKEELKSLFRHWYPNEKSCSLLLDLQKDVPKQLTDINFVQPIISKYNPYLRYFINDLLNLLEPQLPKFTAERIVDLAELIASPQGSPVTLSKVYTVADVRTALQEIDDESDSDCVEIEDECENDNSAPINDSQKIWKLASKEHDWSTCPIGMLPWQSKPSENVEVVN